MKRAFLALLGAVVGSALGFALHQALDPQGPAGDDASSEAVAASEFTVAAPPANIAVAFLAGILTGRRGPIVAFVVGGAISAFLGTRLDRMLPLGQSPSASVTSSLHSSA
jgi:hypothetical protein